MSAYLDSAILIKLYVPEPNSPDAAALAEKHGAPLVFTHLQDNEVKNAIRLKVCRKELTDAEVKIALANLNHDLETGRLARPLLNWPQIWQQADELSDRYAYETNCRTLDTLHVAAARGLGIRQFVSFEQRQRALAAKAGLRVQPSL